MAQTTDQFVSGQQWTGNPSGHSDVQALRQELADTQKKLQGYADAAISLYNELRALRESICKTCKERLIPSMAVTPSPQVAGSAVGSSSVWNRPSRGETVAEPTKFWRRMLKGKQRLDRKGSPDRFASATPNLPFPLSSVSPETSVSPLESVSSRPIQMPINLPPAMEKSVAVSSPLPKPKAPSKGITPKPSAPRWSARKDATANTALNVALVRSSVHKDSVMSVKFSADGKYLAAASGGKSASVVIVDVETGKKIGALQEYASQYLSGARSGLMCVRFSHDGRYLAVADMGARVMVWDIPKKRMRNIFSGHTSEVHSVDFSPNGQLVASACCDSTVRIWNIRDGSAKVFSDNAPEFFSVKFSPNGRYIATGNYDGILRIWDVRTGRLVRRWTGHDAYIYTVTFTADGKGLLSGGFGGVLKYWDVSSLGMAQPGDPVALGYYGHTGTVRCAINSPDTQWIASASEDKTVILWDTKSAKRRYTLLGHEDHVFSIDFSPAGTYLATSSLDGRAALWRYSST